MGSKRTYVGDPTALVAVASVLLKIQPEERWRVRTSVEIEAPEHRPLRGAKLTDLLDESKRNRNSKLVPVLKRATIRIRFHREFDDVLRDKLEGWFRPLIAGMSGTPSNDIVLELDFVDEVIVKVRMIDGVGEMREYLDILHGLLAVFDEFCVSWIFDFTRNQVLSGEARAVLTCEAPPNQAQSTGT